jgi:acetyl-CoA carboxylase biotin carboxyl carrier protein
MARERAERRGEAASAVVQANVSVAVVHQLIRLMNAGDIEEITVEEPDAGMKLTLRKPAPVTVALPDDEFGALDVVESTHDEDETSQQPALQEVRASLVGIFHRSMQPDGKRLVTKGELVREGQPVAAIEALQVYNEVEATEAGTVRDILVEDGQPVEYGQPLFRIEPHRG